MKLATLREGGRDGTLVVVRRDGTSFVRASGIAPTLQAALDAWEQLSSPLAELSERLHAGVVVGEAVSNAEFLAPLPRAYEWVDGSAYLSHMALVRKARGAEMPASAYEEPLVYQGGSGVLSGPTEPLPLPDVSWGLDFEAELCVALSDVPLGAKAKDASRYVRLLLLANDVSLRNLIPAELAKGFGFFQSKPATAFAPFAVTLDEIGSDWRDGRAHLQLRVLQNGQRAGQLETGAEMHFSFFQLVEHIAKTRAFTAGTLLGSGTISSADASRGVGCLAEKRAREKVETGEATTAFLSPGDTVEMELFDSAGQSICGSIRQRVVAT